MRVLITGGHGFIGGRLGRYFKEVGHQVVLGSRRSANHQRLFPDSCDVCVEWNDGASMEQMCSGVDVVIHAAGVNAQECTADPVGALEFNGLATARLHEAASRAGVKRFIYFSTAHVYASPLVGIVSEDTCPRNLHPYSTSHLAGENAVLRESAHGQMEGVVLRLSNAFGSPVAKDVNCWALLVNDLCRQCVQSKQLVLRSSGGQQRDFIPLAEVCRVVEHLSVCHLDVTRPFVFNLGSGESKTVYEMALLVQQRCEVILSYKPELTFPSGRAFEEREMLEYRSERLENVGVKIQQNGNVEIDGLLQFCKRSFG